MNRFLRVLFPRADADDTAVARINRMREEFHHLSDSGLRESYQKATGTEEVIAVIDQLRDSVFV